MYHQAQWLLMKLGLVSHGSFEPSLGTGYDIVWG